MTDTDDKPVRVRIAPSPTGDPHVGTAYMALFNYALARRHGGQFVLRIEDTDRKRSRPEYEVVILDALRWCGLTWDEGPDVGGPYGPYRQSERAALYREHAAQLIDAGHAYHCFQTDEEVAATKKSLGDTLKYRSPDRDLAIADAKARAAAGEPHVVRLRVPDEGQCTFVDQPGSRTVERDWTDVDEQVLVKSDGMPTYHLANVVDDHHMRISHVVRGDEWRASYPKHQLLYAAFGWEMPAVYHMPLLRNADKSKLSKRKNPTSILFYRDQGYLPEALLNFLGLMGYSTKQGDEKLSLDAFVEAFDIDKVDPGGAPVWDTAKLDNLNGRYIREDHTPEQLYGRLKCWLLGDGYLSRTVPMLQQRLTTLGDFARLAQPLLVSEVTVTAEALTPKGMEADAARDLVWSLLAEYEAGSAWAAGPAKQVTQQVAAAWGHKLRQATHVLFVALTGDRVGPPIFDVIELLGKDRTRIRLRAAVDALNGGKPLGKKALSKLEKRWGQARAKAKADAAEVDQA